METTFSPVLRLEDEGFVCLELDLDFGLEVELELDVEGLLEKGFEVAGWFVGSKGMKSLGNLSRIPVSLMVLSFSTSDITKSEEEEEALGAIVLEGVMVRCDAVTNR